MFSRTAFGQSESRLESETFPSIHARVSCTAFYDSKLVSAAGRVRAMAVAVKTCLGDLADQWLTLPGCFGANAGLKDTALVAGMVAGADSVDDMALLRHGGMKKLFAGE